MASKESIFVKDATGAEKVAAFLSKAGVFYVGTTDGDQPKIRAFSWYKYLKDCITDPQTKRFITVNRHARGKKLPVVSCNLSKEVHNLTSINVDHGNGLSLLYLDSFPGTGRYRVFHGVTSIQQAFLVKKI